MPTGVPDTVTGMLNLPAVTGPWTLNVPVVTFTVSRAVPNCTVAGSGSVIVRVLTDGLPKTALPVGVPRMKASVWMGPGSKRSVPVMSSVVCPASNKSGLAVMPLKSSPETAVPLSVNGTVTAAVGGCPRA